VSNVMYDAVLRCPWELLRKQMLRIAHSAKIVAAQVLGLFTEQLMIGQNANVLIVSPAKGWKTVQDFVAYAKAHPGTVNYGSAGVGTATHMSAERFRLSAGFEAVHIPYKGGAEALTDVLGGRVDFYFCPISTALAFIRDDRVRALVVSTPTRMPDLPDVPTSLEAGYRDSDTTIWYAVFMPAKTPRAIVDKFHAAGMKLLASLQMQERLKQLAVYPMPLTPAGIDKLVADEMPRASSEPGGSITRRRSGEENGHQEDHRGAVGCAADRGVRHRDHRRRRVPLGHLQSPGRRIDGPTLLRRHRGRGEGAWIGVALPTGAVRRGHHRRRPGVRRLACRAAEAGARLLPVGNALRHLVVALGSRQAAVSRYRQPRQCRGLRRRPGDGAHPKSGGVRRPWARSPDERSDIRERRLT
jgi:hypothetical protein